MQCKCNGEILRNLSDPSPMALSLTPALTPLCRYQLINLLMHHLRTVVKENRCTLEQICTVFVPHGTDPTAFSSLIR